jgi:nickel transport protein
MKTFALPRLTPLSQRGSGGIPGTCSGLPTAQIPPSPPLGKGGVGVLLLLAFLTAPAHAHDLQHTTTSAQAVVLRLTYTDAKPFAFEGYEVYRQGDTLPYQVGRTDGQGRVAFLPDRAGAWRIKAFSEDGHGLDITLTTDAAAQVAVADKPVFERYGRIVVGVAVILGLFGFISLYLRKRKP